MIEKINNFDYINSSSKFTSELNGRDSYKLPNKKIITFGYPKNDNLISIYNSNKESKCDNNIKNIKDEYLKKFLKNNNINESKSYYIHRHGDHISHQALNYQCLMAIMKTSSVTI